MVETSERLITAYANVINRLEQIEKKGNGNWEGVERRKDAAFSDEQTDKIDKRIDDRLKIHLGDLTLRIFLLAIGAACTIGIGALLAWFGLKK